MTGLQGIYLIDTWTQNPDVCTAEGPSVLGSQTALYIKEETFPGLGSFVNVVDCTDLADCESMAGDEDTIHLGGWGFDQGGDESGWTNSSVSAFDSFTVDGQCEATGTDTVMTSPAEGSIRIEARTTAEVLFPRPASVTDCFDLEDDVVAAELEGQPCAQFEVVTATFDRALP